MMNPGPLKSPKRQLHEYKPHVFTASQRAFLMTVGWANIPADDLVERVSHMVRDRPPEIERVTYLTRALLDAHLFAERRRAYAFARSYTDMVDTRTDLKMIVWDWE